VAAELFFASMGAAIKLASSEVSSELVVFFRNLFGLVFLLPWLVRRGLGGLATRQLGWHLTRGLAGLAAMYCFFYALAHIPLAEAVLMMLTSPLFLPLLAFAWLGERVTWTVGGAVALGFVGVMLILRPGFGELSAVVLVALAGGAFAALAKTGIRRLTRTEPIARVVFYFALIATVVSAVPLAWAWTPPSPAAWGLLAAVGLLATVGQVFMTAAYGLAPAAQVGPFTYTSVLFATAYGWLFWDEAITVLTAVGAVLVVATGLLASQARERAARDPGARAAPAGGDAPLAPQ
jgi:drug/metabolite transporter (DMT)-like permease